MAKADPVPPVSVAPDLRVRILRQARLFLFTHGYARCTMDELAAELGLSKKTLYVHFAGKDEILAAVVDDVAGEIRAEAEALLRNPDLNFAAKLRGFVAGMAQRHAALKPQTFRELQRFAPALYRRIEEMRARTLPYVFGRFVEVGQRDGLVRTDLPPGFAIEYFLHAMQGLLQPAVLERLQLAPPAVLGAGIDLFFGGLLTPAGRKQYEKIAPR